jgi:hypothetical protein
MGISLNGLTPAGTYPGLIKTGDNTAISGTPKVLSDGNGNNLPMEVSTTGVNLTGSPTVNAVAIANTTQVAAKQDTLVSGTNIKTINGTSVLGSGDIVTPFTPPSGVAGAIQFSTGSAFGSDAANLFWDDTNNRLGIGTNVPSVALEVVGQGRFSDNILFSTDFKHIGRDLNNSSISFSSINSRILAKISTGGSFEVYNSASGTSRFAVSNSGQTTISGGGSTSATTALLVQNSSGTEAVKVFDNLRVDVRAELRVLDTAGNNAMIMYGDGFSGTKTLWVAGSLGLGGAPGNNASARLQVDSTTQGFLPPRMTTTQKNAIASPAAGLVLYDSTTNKLQCYNGSTWNDLF